MWKSRWPIIFYFVSLPAMTPPHPPSLEARRVNFPKGRRERLTSISSSVGDNMLRSGPDGLTGQFESCRTYGGNSVIICHFDDGYLIRTVDVTTDSGTLLPR